MGEVSPAFFQQLEKSAPIFGKKYSDCGHLWVTFFMRF